MSVKYGQGEALSAEYRPLWWRPWLEPIAPPLAPADDSPDVTGFQMPGATAPVEPALARDGTEREP